MSAAATMNLTRDQAIAQLWLRGILTFKFHAGQAVIEKAYNAVTGKLFVCTISRRFGKTWWAAVKALEKAIQVPYGRIKIATAFQKDVEEFIIPVFDMLLADCPDSLRPKYNASKKKYLFRNGAEIALIGLDRNPNGGRGNYCDLYIFDEAGFISRLDYLYSSVVVPMTMYRPGAKVIMISTPSVTAAHPFEEFCKKAESEKAFVKLTIYDNPLATPELIELYKAECLDESDWEREYLCEWAVPKTRRIIPEWNDSFIAEPEVTEITRFWHRYEGMDLGVKRDKTVDIFAHYNFLEARLYCLSEIDMMGPDMTTELLAGVIRAKECELWPAPDDDDGDVGAKPGPKSLKVYRRVADNNNPLLLQDLGSLHGLHFLPVSKDELHAMVNEARIWIKAGRLRVSPRCPQVLGCLKWGVWDEARKEFDRSKVYGHFDALAALIYLIRSIDQHVNPIPHDWGFDTRNSVIKTTPLTPAQNTIKNLFRRPPV